MSPCHVVPRKRVYGHYNSEIQMAHPLQSRYDRVSTLLGELRVALEDHAVFRSVESGLMNSSRRTSWNSRFTWLVTPSWRTHSISLQPKF
jgi:hypothetical protein